MAITGFHSVSDSQQLASQLEIHGHPLQIPTFFHYHNLLRIPLCFSLSVHVLATYGVAEWITLMFSSKAESLGKCFICIVTNSKPQRRFTVLIYCISKTQPKFISNSQNKNVSQTEQLHITFVNDQSSTFSTSHELDGIKFLLRLNRTYSDTFARSKYNIILNYRPI